MELVFEIGGGIDFGINSGDSEVMTDDSGNIPKTAALSSPTVSGSVIGIATKEE